MKKNRIKVKRIPYILISASFISISASADLVGHWSFNQDNGCVVYDSIRSDENFNGGQVIGSVPRFIVSGAGVKKRNLGNAYRFESESSYISLFGRSEIFNIGTDDFTFTAWFKQSPVEQLNNPDQSPSIIHNSKHDRQGIILMINREGNPARGRLSFNVKGAQGGNCYVNSDKRVDDGSWHWVAIRVKNKRMEMWVDNGHQSMTSIYREQTCATQYNPTRFGGMSNDLSLDELRMYNSALTTDQLRQIYHAENAEVVNTVLQKPSKDVVFYRVNPISNIVRVPDTPPVDGKQSDVINIAATPGEFEPSSIILYTRNGLSRVSFEADDLTGTAGIIAAGNIDIRAVKCWYQSGTAWQNLKGHRADSPVRFLVPELLLRDDAMVQVDYKNRTNYVKLHDLEGDRYVDMSQVNPENQPGMLNSQFPVYDSPVLLPLNIPENTYKQMWITIRVPEQSKPGRYTGNIKVQAEGELLQTLKLNLEVLPFKLATPGTCYDSDKIFTSSIYYKGILSWDREGGLRGWYKTREQFCADLKNMAEHGVDNPLILQLEVDDNLDHLERVLEIRTELGLKNDPLYLLGKERNLGIGISDDPEKIRWAQQRFREIDAVAKKHGIKQLFVYGFDEARGDKVVKQKPVWKAFHEVGAKVFVAGFMNHASPDMFDLADNTLDILVSAGVPYREFADKWHSTDKKIWCYGNPQGGVENPEVYRRNFGLLLWKANYDGACTYVYHHGYGHSWNDFDSPRYRDHNLTYPTVNGVIDTIAWEGYREGIDDIRYATTLKKLIAKIQKEGSPDQKKIAEEAFEWLENLDVELCDLDEVRTKMIEYILQLN